MTAPAKTLLSIVELGGYPDFRAIYERAGFKVETINSVRKAITALRTMKPDVIVAEFNYQSDFRDRTSSLESLLATMQSRA
jgi:ActR/RegA family two-component response regulator